MPGYKTHITWSSIAGIGLGCFAKLFYDVSIPQAVFGGVLCSLGGVLPDIDSDTSRAYERCITTISGASVLLLASRLSDFNLEPEGVVTACAAVYFFIIYVIGGIVKKLTIHRGMCHSIPFAIIAGEIIFILSSGSTQLRFFKAMAIVSGVMIHLLLDEMNSFDVGTGSSRKSSSYSNGYEDDYGYERYSGSRNGKYGRWSYGRNNRNSRGSSNSRKKRGIRVIRVKSSFGTALKLIDYKHLGTTIIFYVVAAFLGHCAMGVQDFLQKFGDVDQKEIQGHFAIERAKRLYPTQYDLSVVQWIAENNLVLRPGNKDNTKWNELQKMLAIGEDAAEKKRERKDGKKTGLFSTSKSDAKSKENADEEVVSLLDVINWNSLNKSEEEQSKSSNSQ